MRCSKSTEHRCKILLIALIGSLLVLMGFTVLAQARGRCRAQKTSARPCQTPSTLRTRDGPHSTTQRKPAHSCVNSECNGCSCTDRVYLCLGSSGVQRILRKNGDNAMQRAGRQSIPRPVFPGTRKALRPGLKLSQLRCNAVSMEASKPIARTLVFNQATDVLLGPL